MAGDSVVGAIPDNLINYGIHTTLLDGKISAQATTLGRALSAFINSNPDPKYISSVPRLDQNVFSLASSANGTDAWVGRVGEAFKAVAQQELGFLERHTGETGLNAGAMLTTSTESTISSYAAGMGSAFQADVQAYVAEQQYAQGQRDAKALIKALEGPNATDLQIQTIVQRLRSHLSDHDYLAGYFAALGPRRTLQITDSLIPPGKGLYPPLAAGNPLQTFDEALAGASNSPLLPAGFVTQVFPNYDLSKLDTAGRHDETANYLWTMSRATMLLRYGDYSQTFLGQALQTIVMPYMGTPQRQLVGDSRLNPQVVQRNDIVLQALARNPVADAQILSSTYTFTMDGRTFDSGPNIALILRTYGAYDNRDGGGSSGGAALSAAIAAITKDTSAQDRMTVLQDVGSLSWQDIPDGARTGIATLLTHDISNPAFLNQDRPAANLNDPRYLTWQESLFIAATTNHDGSKDKAGLNMLKAAVKSWFIKNPPPTIGDEAGTSTWMHHFGSLSGLVALGVVAGGYQSAADKAAEFNFYEGLINDAVGVATAPLKTGPSVLVSMLFNQVESVVASHLSPTDTGAEVTDLQSWRTTRASAETYLTMTDLLRDPSALPASVRAALQQDPRSPAVQQFIATVTSARDITDIPAGYGLTPSQQQQIGHIINDKNALASQIDPYFEIKFN